MAAGFDETDDAGAICVACFVTGDDVAAGFDAAVGAGAAALSVACFVAGDDVAAGFGAAVGAEALADDFGCKGAALFFAGALAKA